MRQPGGRVLRSMPLFGKSGHAVNATVVPAPQG